MNASTSDIYKERINAVVDHIHRNISNEISLKSLSDVANYSPFHLQKIFKLITGASPKQYLMKLKLETALHSLVVYPHKTIAEIASDTGFSSSAVFSRAVRNHFGATPQQLRNATPEESHGLLKKVNFDHAAASIERPSASAVRIVKRDTIQGIYLLTSFGDVKGIQDAFRTVSLVTQASDFSNSQSAMYGIINFHQADIYRAFISFPGIEAAKTKLNHAEIKPGKYAAVKVRGSGQETLKSVRAVFHTWLRGSGYRIAHTIGFEEFDGDPSLEQYTSLQREVFIPIESA
jgi:AraC family transcriptional regulator